MSGALTGARDEEKEQEEREKTSCQQEPSFPEGKIKREEPREKTFDQEKISSATQISPRERGDGKPKRRDGVSLSGATESALSPRWFIWGWRGRLQRPLSCGRCGFGESPRVVGRRPNV